MKYINEGMKIKVLDKYAEMKLLDVTFDEHLKFTSHLDELSKRVSRKIGVMMRLKNVIPTFSRGWNLQIFGFATNKDGMALL